MWVSVLSFACLSAPAGPATTQPAPPRAATTRPAKPKLLAEFDVAKGGEPIIVPVRFKGRQYPFLLDTGASISLFDVSLKPELGPVQKTLRFTTASGRTRLIELFDPPKATWACVNLADAGLVGCMDMKIFRHMLGRDLRGVLGVGAMKKHVVQMDFDRGKLRLFAPVGPRRRPQWGVSVRIEFGPGGLPCTMVQAGGNRRIACFFDTGMMDTGQMPPPMFNAHVRQFKLKTAAGLAAGAASVHTVRSARIPQFKIGPLQYKGLIFDEGPRFALGLGLLSRHLVTFDFPNGRLYLKPGKDVDRADEIDMSGLALVRRPAGTVVFAVRANSPAKKAGIRPEDVILEVNGKEAGKYTMAELKELLRCGHGKKITMSVRRGEEVLKVQFALEKQI